MKAKTFGGLKRFIAMTLAVLMVAVLIPFAAFNSIAATADVPSADASTLDGWKDYFGSNGTQNTGKIWTDKSVLSDASKLGNSNITLSDKENYLVALSALASDTNIEGYSATPTDTMIMLDISGSMKGLEDDLLKACNDAIKTLFSINEHNRVGVVAYNYQALTILPLGRYTPDSNGKYIDRHGKNGFFGIATGVVNEITGEKIGQNMWDNRDSNWYNFALLPGGATFTQSALLLAYEQFKGRIDAKDTKIAPDQFQAGETRTPVYILMSDGAPTFANMYYADPNSVWKPGDEDYWERNTKSNNYIFYGNGEYEKSEGIAFLTQLTASFVRTFTERGKKLDDGTLTGGYNTDALFYTLGLQVDDQPCAHAVVNPTGVTDSLWNKFYDNSSDTMAFDVITYDDNTETTGYLKKSITTQSNHPNVDYRDYVTEYYPADNIDQLMDNFNTVVNEVLVQSRYYPTHVSGLDPNADGYVSFSDKLGKFVDLKEIKGILFNDKFYSGYEFAKNINSGALGTESNPTALGDELIYSIKARLGIDTRTARALVSSAYQAGQIKYTGNTNFSNYIGWYADKDGKFLEFHDGISAPTKSGAAYAVRSYGFVGETSGSIKGSDLMYMGVRVLTELSTGEQTVEWDIPASLVPVMNYKVTVPGRTLVGVANDAFSLTIEEESPIRLIYEVGLDDSINPSNIEEKMAEAGYNEKTANGSYAFWTNAFDGDNALTTATYTPSKQNGAFYYREDSNVYWRSDKGDSDPSNDEYLPLGWVDALTSPNYYYKDYYFKSTGNGNKAEIVYTYPRIADSVVDYIESIGARRNDDANGDPWYIPAGTGDGNTINETIDKVNSTTNSVSYVSKTTANTEKSTTLLGNNGILFMTPVPEGSLVVSKTIEMLDSEGNASALTDAEKAEFADMTFDFTVEFSGECVAGDSCINRTVTVNGNEVTPVNGKITFSLKNGESVTISGIAQGLTYKVTEGALAEGFAVKENNLTGTIGATESRADFVNYYNAASVTVDANISIEKILNGRDFLDGDEFSFELYRGEYGTEGAELIGNAFTLYGKDVNDGKLSALAFNLDTEIYLAEGEYTYSLREVLGEIAGITYDETVNVFVIKVADENRDGKLEIAGIESQSENLTVTENEGAWDIAATFNNIYVPSGETEITIDITKEIDTPADAEYSLDGFNFGVYMNDELVASASTDENGKAEIVLDFTAEDIGKTFGYVLKEIVPETPVEGMTYTDKTFEFNVTVFDNFDGTIGTLIGETEADSYSATFTNIYAPGYAFVALNGDKVLEGRDIVEGEFSFNLYETGADFSIDGLEPIETVNVALDGSFAFDTIFYSELATKYYVVTETKGDLVGVEYDETVYNVTVDVVDGKSGDLVANVSIADADAIVFTNVYTPIDIDVVIDINKVVENNSDVEIGLDGFNFVLESDDKVIGKVVSDENGKASFTLEFSDADLGKTFSYTLSEVDDGMEFMEYSKVVYEYTVEIVRDENGDVVAVLTQNGEATDALTAEFVNTYNYVEPPVETPEPPVETPEPPVETPEPPVETPEPPVETPEPPVETPEPPSSVEPPVEPPKPGDTSDALLLIGLIVLSVGVGFAVIRSRKKEQPDF